MVSTAIRNSISEQKSCVQAYCIPKSNKYSENFDMYLDRANDRERETRRTCKWDLMRMSVTFATVWLRVSVGWRK